MNLFKENYCSSEWINMQYNSNCLTQHDDDMFRQSIEMEEQEQQQQ